MLDCVLDLLNASYDLSEMATTYFRAINLTNQSYSNIGEGWHAPGRFLQAGVDFRF